MQDPDAIEIDHRLTTVYASTFLVILLILCIVHCMNKKTMNIEDNRLLMKTDKHIYSVSQEICIAYLATLRKDILLLYKRFDKSKYSELQHYIKSARVELQQFIGLQNEYSSSISRECDLIRENIINTRILSDDEDSGIIDVLANIDAIMNLMQESGKVCTDMLNLADVHALMEIMHDNACQDISGSYYSTDTTNDTSVEDTYSGIINEPDLQKISDTAEYNNKIDTTYMHNKYVVHAGANLRNAIQSQSINACPFEDNHCFEDENFVYKQFEKKNKRALTCSSQQFTNSEEASTNNKSMSSAALSKYIPSYDINKSRSERQKMRMIKTDINCKRSLRNDYDYLDF